MQALSMQHPLASKASYHNPGNLQVSGAAAAEGAGNGQAAAFPPMAAADAQRYEYIFQQMDADKDNYVLVSSAASPACLKLTLRPPDVW